MMLHGVVSGPRPRLALEERHPFLSNAHAKASHDVPAKGPPTSSAKQSRSQAAIMNRFTKRGHCNSRAMSLRYPNRDPLAQALRQPATKLVKLWKRQEPKRDRPSWISLSRIPAHVWFQVHFKLNSKMDFIHVPLLLWQDSGGDRLP